MDSLNVFESAFRRAIRDKYEYGAVKVTKVLLLTDLDPEPLAAFEKTALSMMQRLLGAQPFEVTRVEGRQFANWEELKNLVNATAPDVIVSYRLLRVRDRVETSLGVYIDALSQSTDYPILILPNPRFSDHTQWAKPEQGAILVATEHLFADNRLVNYAVGFTPREGQLLLAHIEDADTFEYYLKAIAQIPEIDTEAARQELHRQLLENPQHYMESVREVLSTERPDIQVDFRIDLGHLITSYKKMLTQETISLLVVQTKDDTQLAAHSLGYSLTIEFSNIPVLLI